MKCNHGHKISKCEVCLDKLMTYLVKNECKCYVNAFLALPGTNTVVVKNFTQEELYSSICNPIPLTASCDGLDLQLSKCRSPTNKWCKYVDRSNSFITSIVVPRGCGGCYNFDLSASVALNATLNTGIVVVGGASFPLSTPISLQATADLKLSEQLPREVCVVDEFAESIENCFTALTLPIIDVAHATETLNGTDIGLIAIISILLATIGGTITSSLISVAAQQSISNLAVSGIVCLKDCQRLVPTITLKNLPDLDSILNSIDDILPPGVVIEVIPFTLTNIQLVLSSLSLKLVKIDNCPQDCDCKNHSIN